MTVAPFFASRSRCGPTAAISSSALRSASRPEYQPDTSARSYCASSVFNACGSRGNLLPSSKPLIADLPAFGQRDVERRFAAERGQVVVHPRQRIDADAYIESVIGPYSLLACAGRARAVSCAFIVRARRAHRFTRRHFRHRDFPPPAAFFSGPRRIGVDADQVACGRRRARVASRLPVHRYSRRARPARRARAHASAKSIVGCALRALHAIVDQVVERRAAAGLLQAVDATVAAIVEHHDDQLRAEHDRRRDLAVHHQIAAVADDHDHFALRAARVSRQGRRRSRSPCTSSRIRRDSRPACSCARAFAIRRARCPPRIRRCRAPPTARSNAARRRSHRLRAAARCRRCGACVTLLDGRRASSSASSCARVVHCGVGAPVAECGAQCIECKTRIGFYRRGALLEAHRMHSH